MSNKLGVLQLIDSLHVGGAERMAVNIANGFVNGGLDSYLVCTRTLGLLRKSVHHDVKVFCLDKKASFDLNAIKKLKKIVEEHNIKILHAHSSTIFIAVSLKKLYNKKLKIVWHNHNGESQQITGFKLKALRFLVRQCNFIINVNQELNTWVEKGFGINKKRIKYLANFPSILNSKLESELPGISGKRIVLVGNIRSPKGYEFLIDIAKELQKSYPDWTFISVGKKSEDEYNSKILGLAKEANIENLVFLGLRTDVQAIISTCDIAIMTSKHEGLPVTLLEYGMLNKPVVCTNVGDCSRVLNNPSWTVDYGDVTSFVQKLIELIENENIREAWANRFNLRVAKYYSEESAIFELNKIYTSL